MSANFGSLTLKIRDEDNYLGRNLFEVWYNFFEQFLIESDWSFSRNNISIYTNLGEKIEDLDWSGRNLTQEKFYSLFREKVALQEEFSFNCWNMSSKLESILVCITTKYVLILFSPSSLRIPGTKIINVNHYMTLFAKYLDTRNYSYDIQYSVYADRNLLLN